MQNTSGTKIMTEGKVKKLILQFAIPIFFSQLFQQLYNTADSLEKFCLGTHKIVQKGK